MFYALFIVLSLLWVIAMVMGMKSTFTSDDGSERS